MFFDQATHQPSCQIVEYIKLEAGFNKFEIAKNSSKNLLNKN